MAKWKLVAAILNCWIIASITYHDFLQGFQADRGTDATTFKAKLIQKLARMRGEILNVIFLDLHKEYINLYRER